MPNVALITFDDQPLILPAHSISAIICVADQELDHAPGALSMIYSEFRGGTSYFLAQTSADVLETVKAGDPMADRWIVLAAEVSTDDPETHAIARSCLQGFQGHAKGGMGEDNGPWLEAFIIRPSSNPSAREATLALKATEENRFALTEILLTAPDASPVPVPRPAKQGKK